jgi:hypothetical protein
MGLSMDYWSSVIVISYSVLMGFIVGLMWREYRKEWKGMSWRTRCLSSALTLFGVGLLLYAILAELIPAVNLQLLVAS